MTMAAIAVVGSAALSYAGSQAAAGAAQQSNQQNIAFQQQANAQRDPFSSSGARAQYVPQLNALMQGGYQGIQNDPMFQWQQGQGMEAVQRMMAARGQGAGTNDLLALQNQAYGFAGDFFNQQYNRLAQLSGAAQGGAGIQTVQGMSPTTAGGVAMAPYTAGAQAFGGLSSIFGRGQGGDKVTTDYSIPGTYTEY